MASGKEAVYQSQNFGNPLGFGRLPALIVVDFVNGFNDTAVLGGGNIAEAIERTVPLLATARDYRIPIAFTRIVYRADGSDAGAFARKLPRLLALTEDNPASQVVDELQPLPGELIVRKTQASAFFGTGLADQLKSRGVDTLLVTGCTTSGCVRATVVDGIAHEFLPIVVRECVGDRALEPHEANLFDMEQKYADIVGRDEVLHYLRTIAKA